ncbi:1-(5-phosphoribosyl)-5-amino-4-imidazole-carboxyl ate carboxylase [Paractinoplanes abujensis]|uniref:NCAIR mutase (PurE)-related protein n=1 Tax=Paractinoplanes abujensis TaxID=882441 RepID=A0A7W7G2Y1_9ACTN|nr:nickel pincer cofactor biosynthesis protein LarB [Actinoplanes abujensis]MBB4692126.1 NCAIR mutase (PurE)-related protein [Actinoplanes abujensis]GID16459.1 1-(5-phosphoribosyl)-5-amino-4-imidazole-carboxyl ate carboxylase [Actinoplanes abujensis]
MTDDLATYAHLDRDRTRRRGYPEAVYCAHKTAEQVAGIAAALRDSADGVTLFTRAGDEHARAILATLPGAFHDPAAGLLAWPPRPPRPTGERVVVVAAGTSDLPVAREAALTAQYLGRTTDLIVDVGVAGLHRILGHVDTLRRARAVVVVAGMDGALPGVVAGLIAAPVIAVPTSVGYGAAFEGLAALLTMLNACAPGVAVVNIDNGYGAGHLAAQITAPTSAVSAAAAPERPGADTETATGEQHSAGSRTTTTDQRGSASRAPSGEQPRA